MGLSDFQKLSRDRAAQNIKRSVTNPTSVNAPLTIGDITKGEVVEVLVGEGVTTDTGGTARVKERRTGAILLGYTTSSGDSNLQFKWSIDRVTLTLLVEASTVAIFRFWVF